VLNYEYVGIFPNGETYQSTYDLPVGEDFQYGKTYTTYADTTIAPWIPTTKNRGCWMPDVASGTNVAIAEVTF